MKEYIQEKNHTVAQNVPKGSSEKTTETKRKSTLTLYSVHWYDRKVYPMLTQQNYFIEYPCKHTIHL